MDMNHPFDIPAELNKKILQTLETYQMLKPGDAVLAAVSGGPDSVALFRFLLDLTTHGHYQFKLGVAHLNHLIRGSDALEDEAFVRKLAQDADVPFYCEKKDVKTHAKESRQSVEQAGRELRYAFLDSLCSTHGYTKIALGHTRDDNAELVLMNLLRGAAAKGLSGIPPIRGNRYIRPLIQVSKKEILSLLDKNQLPYRIDASNTDPAFLRNRIRHRLIPLLESEYNPEVVDALDRSSRILKQEDDFLEIRMSEALTTCLIRQDDDRIVLSKERLAGLHPALLNRVLRASIKTLKKNLDRISLAHMHNMVTFCFSRTDGKSLDLPGRIRIYKTRKTIEIKMEKQNLRRLGKAQKTLRRPSEK